MRAEHTDPADERPEADVAEQASDVSQDVLADEPPGRFTEADEADVLEQATNVPSADEDDYPDG